MTPGRTKTICAKVTMNDFNVGEIMRVGKGVVDGGEKENGPFF